MTAVPIIDMSGWLNEHLEQASPDLLRAERSGRDFLDGHAPLQASSRRRKRSLQPGSCAAATGKQPGAAEDLGSHALRRPIPARAVPPRRNS
jgi:hypothetical protein